MSWNQALGDGIHFTRVKRKLSSCKKISFWKLLQMAEMKRR